jgi:Zn-finger nucleic acid-binding protein
MDMILACTSCDSRYDVTGHAIGQKFKCRCGTLLTLSVREAEQAAKLACPQCGAGVSATDKTCTHCTTALMLKGCPRCLSRVFHGHKHCPECGAELSVAAIDTKVERVCPRCTTTLHARAITDTVIDECETCHGIFLDHIAVKRVVTDRQQARAEAILGALPAGTITASVPRAGERMYIKCPVCTTVMNRKLFSMGSGVIIDVCRAHGVFFDAGELPRVIDFVMAGGL